MKVKIETVEEMKEFLECYYEGLYSILGDNVSLSIIFETTEDCNIFVGENIDNCIFRTNFKQVHFFTKKASKVYRVSHLSDDNVGLYGTPVCSTFINQFYHFKPTNQLINSYTQLYREDNGEFFDSKEAAIAVKQERMNQAFLLELEEVKKRYDAKKIYVEDI